MPAAGSAFSGVTAQPTGEWLAQLTRTLLMDLEDAGQSFRFLLRDHDRKFSRVSDTVFAAASVQVVTMPVRAPRANAIAERFVGSLRRQLLHRILIVNRRHAAAVLAEYEQHFNDHRPDRALGQKHRCGRFPTHAQAKTSGSADMTASAASSTSTPRSRSRAQLQARRRPRLVAAPATA
jgi:hypothetical protein